MDSELKCNRLTCRRTLSDKAVVTTCSHIFCVDCANELFNAARLCPACDTSLTEPDDVVVCSLHPTNDYKTSVLSGLTPSIVLEICSRAISFWQYQIHQENTFQQAVIRNLNDKNAQLQKQLDNVVREANGEISLLNNKKEELERDLELERRKVREAQDTGKERDKEYQKLKIHFDKLKRKALFGPAMANENAAPGNVAQNQYPEDQRPKARVQLGTVGSVDLTQVIGGMEANRVQRTPLVPRTNGGGFMNINQQPMGNHDWGQPGHRAAHRQPFGGNFGDAGQGDHSYRSVSDRSGSVNEVESMLTHQNPARKSITTSSGWQIPNSARSGQRVFAPTTNKAALGGGRFRPAR